MVESSAPGNGESTPPTSTSTPITPPIEAVEAAGPGLPLGATDEGIAASPESTGEPSIEPAAESPVLQVSAAAPEQPDPPSPEPSPVPSTVVIEPSSELVAALEPTFISSIEVPADPTTVGEGGGEWELLISKIRKWLESGELKSNLQSARTPLLALGALVGLVLVLRIYGALLGAIDSLPLVSGLLELTGVIWLARFGATNLVRSSERQALLSGLQRRWKAFFGNS
ncbi:MAG: CAAD domain-containing protein [Prochlorococcaceae cyanobacterium]